MKGSTLAHYRILDELGAGGMGEVYLAEDTTLHRRVALKVLPAELAGSPERLERFEREARTLAALDHPHIVTLHSVEEADGVRFLTMAYVEGETLGELIPEGGLPVERLLELALPLAEGVAAAHGRGIVHRDLKPGNVMVDRTGRLRILDFGLAKLQPEPGPGPESHLATETLSPEMTREGSVLGTYPYMSPEQAEGKAADSRSDLFSLGSVLYEMATGKRPFAGESAASFVSSILKDTPPSLADARPDLPARLGEIVERCLEKDPADRYQTAAELRDELAALARKVTSGEARSAARLRRARRWRTAGLAAGVLLLALLAGLRLWRTEQAPPPSGEPRIDSIAVLPLRNLSGDPEQEYFADGMTEALITDLSKIGALRVISRSSAMRYKETEMAVAEIAAELGVDALVEGSVVREGNRVGITAQLLEAATGENLWAERYERDLVSILSLQGEIARAVARQVEVTLTPEEDRLLAGTSDVDPEAYEDYLRGTFHINKLTPEGIEQGLAYLHKAVEKDPASALAHAGLALGYVLVASHSPETAPPDSLQRAQAAYRKALELDDTLAEAHAALAEAKLYSEWDWEGARRAFLRSLELNPNLARAHTHYAWYLNLVGRQREAVAEIERAHRLDPLDPLKAAWVGAVHAVVGQYEEAVAAAREAPELNPGFARGLYILGWALAGSGEYEEAIVASRRAAELDPRWRAALGVTYALAGRREDALEIAATVDEPFFLAQLHGALGDRDAALRSIERAIEQRHPFAPWAFRYVELVELLGDEPRYQELRKELGLAAPAPAIGMR